MLKTPSSRRKKLEHKLDLVPIMDAIFIFIFFLLFSANFVTIFEINSDAPILSSEPPQDNKEPLALTLVINPEEIVITTTNARTVVKKIQRMGESYNYNELHDFMIQMRLKHLTEDTVILEPSPEVSYDEIIKIMDEIRIFRNTDESIFIKSKDGVEEKLKFIFNKVVFGNLMN
jgi:biopolymer transport protein ExbD